MCNHTDLQDKYCGHSNDIHPVQSLRACAQGGPGGLALWAGDLGWPSAPPRQQGGLEGGTPRNVGSGNFNFLSPEGMSDLVLAWNGKSENWNSSITKS